MLINSNRGTNNLEWYDPETLTTVGGSLQITLRRERNHGMQYMGGMMATWNKFCFTGLLNLYAYLAWIKIWFLQVGFC